MEINSDQNKYIVETATEVKNKSKPTCPRCGHIGRADAIYCEKCGARIHMSIPKIQNTEITQELPKVTV